jgi:hypothetical protein
MDITFAKCFNPSVCHVKSDLIVSVHVSACPAVIATLQHCNIATLHHCRLSYDQAAVETKGPPFISLKEQRRRLNLQQIIGFLNVVYLTVHVICCPHVEWLVSFFNATTCPLWTS